MLLFLVFNPSFPVFAQNTVSLAAEVARLEKLSLGAPTSQERYDALFSLARLRQLSGDSEAAIKSLDGALAVIPGDIRAVFEKGRLFISLGEFEKAVETAAALLARGNEKECLLRGRFLIAQLEAFRSGDIMPLAALTGESDFSEYLSGIYYTIWKLSNSTEPAEILFWKNRLTSEFPQSPEAKIAGSKAIPAVTPLWLLSPGREGARLPAPTSVSSRPAAPAPAVSSTPSAPVTGTVSPAAPTPSQSSVSQTALLQTGLFGREENARALAERLTSAGFQPHIQRRLVNSSDYWVVTVSGGADMNATIRKLKDAGFDSFPLKE